MFSAVLRHDRMVVMACLLVVTLLAWGYILFGSGMDMGRMPTAGGPMTIMAPPAWTQVYATLIFLMWAIMMVAMMLPSAAPAILLAAALTGRGGESHRFGPTGLFTLGYLMIWFGFSLVATMLQWGLQKIGLLSADMISLSVILSGVTLIAAGIYQLTPWKRTCLARCRSPFDLMTKYWHRGRMGPMLAGIWNGFFCLGCCWMIMVLLFVGGVMNILWIAAIAALVAVEKLLPGGPRASQVTGILLVVAGGIVLVG
jgi:predicted metal-binding membrane protein